MKGARDELGVWRAEHFPHFGNFTLTSAVAKLAIFRTSLLGYWTENWK